MITYKFYVGAIARGRYWGVWYPSHPYPSRLHDSFESARRELFEALKTYPAPPMLDDLVLPAYSTKRS